MRRIVTFLRDQGIGVWLDNEKLIPGTPVWEEEIENAIAAASAIVVILSPDAKTSTWVRREISLADQHDKRIFPVLVRGDEGSSISLRLIGRQYVDLRKDEETGLNSLSITLLSYLKEQDAKRKGVKKEEPFARGSAQAERKEQDAGERVQKEKNKAELQAALDEIDRKAAERTAGERAEREKMSRPAPAQPARKTGLSATVIVMSVVAAAICGCGGILLLPGLLNPVTPLPYDYPTEAFADFPTASPTEIPSVEPPPTDAPTFEIPSTGEDAVILHDIFDDNSNGWYMRSGETEFAIDNTEISDGVFIWDIQETKKGFVAYETYPNAQILENFYVSVNVMLLSAPQQCLLWDSVPLYECEQVSL